MQFLQRNRLEAQNYDDIGIEYQNLICNDRQFVGQIIKENLAYADEKFLCDFYEEVRVNLDGTHRYSDRRLSVGILGGIVFALVWMIVVPKGWLLIFFFTIVGIVLGCYTGKFFA